MEKTIDTKIDLSVISSINEKISSRMDLSDLLTSIMDVAKELIDAEGCSLLLSDKQTGDLYFYVVSGDHNKTLVGEKVPKGKGIAGSVTDSGAPVIVNNVQNDPRFFDGIDLKADFKTENIMGIPMVVMGELVGVLEIVNIRKPDGFCETDVQKAKYIADQAAMAITNRQLYDDLTKRIDELTSLFRVSQAISFAGKDENVLYKIIVSLAESMGVERASIIIYNTESKSLKIEASYGLPKSITRDYEIDMDNSIVGYVYKTCDPMISVDINKEEFLPDSFDRKGYKTNSFLSIPIIYKNSTIGVLSITDKKNRKPFDAFDLRVLTTVSSQIAETYQNIQNQKNIEKQRRLEQEIDIASDIQRRILPKIPKNLKNHQLVAYNKPAKVVGGDFYDYFMFDDNKYALLVADISGKGIPAALFMGAARNVIRAERRVDTTPSHLLHNANTQIYLDSEYGMFVTLFYATIDSHNNLITYGSAGHDDQLLIRNKTREIVRLSAAGKALGIVGEQQFEEKVVLYEPGDMMILFTDGVVECLGGKELDIEKGEQKLADLGLEYIDKGPEALVKVLQKNLHNNSMDVDSKDDFTILAVKF